MYAIIPIHTANLQAINALGRSDLFLKLEIIKKTMGISIIVITLPFGVHALAIGSAIGGLIGSFLNAYPNKSLLNYSYSEQVKDILPSLSISFVMGAVVYAMNYLSLPVGVILGSQVVVGSLLYVLLAMYFKLESFIYLKQTIKDLLKQYKKDVVKT
jgi:O-antigen/teichoic acid export membrane protein